MPLLHRSLTTTLFGLLALTAASPSRAQLLDATWIGPAAGDWSDAANWSTGVVPDLGAYAVRVDANAAQATTVGVDGQFTVFDLSLDEGDSLALAEGALLELNEVSTVAGEVQIAPTASFLARSLLLIEPSGRIRLEPGEEGAGVALLSRGPSGDDRWNRGVIEGAGEIQTTGNFINSGVIEANVNGRPLDLMRVFPPPHPFAFVNDGVLRAVDGGVLRYHPTEAAPSRLVNRLGSQDGRVEALPGSSVQLNSIFVEGGVLSGAPAVEGPGGTTPGGTLSITDGGVRDVTIEGEIELTSSEIAGVINNTGTMNALGASVRGTTELRGGGSVIVGGPTGFGTISIAESGSDSTRTLINHDNVIRGNGGISFGVNRTGLFINRETIEAGFGPDETPAQNVGFGVLGYGSDTHRVVNSGSIRALTNAELRLSGVAVTNHEGATPGLVEAMSGGVVTLDNVTISGGILRAAPSPAGSGSPATAAGLVVVEAAELADLRLEGTIGDASDFGTIALAGAIDNRGALNAYDLALAEDAELRGGGEVNIGGRLALSDDATRDRRLTLTNHDNRIRLDSVDSSEPIGIANYGTLASVRDEDTSVDVSDLGQADLINGGIVNAETGSRLVVGSISADPAHNDTAVVHAEAGATIRAARIVGGTVTTAPAEGDLEAGRVEVLRPNGTTPNEVNFGDVRNLGVVEVSGFLGGEIQNENEIIVPVGAVGLDHLVRFSGNGVLHVAEGARLIASTSDVSRLSNGPGHTLTGQGTIVHTGGTMINEGTILADDGQLRVSLLVVGRMLHTGVLRSEGGGNPAHRRRRRAVHQRRPHRSSRRRDRLRREDDHQLGGE